MKPDVGSPAQDQPAHGPGPGTAAGGGRVGPPRGPLAEHGRSPVGDCGAARLRSMTAARLASGAARLRSVVTTRCGRPSAEGASDGQAGTRSELLCAVPGAFWRSGLHSGPTSRHIRNENAATHQESSKPAPTRRSASSKATRREIPGSHGGCVPERHLGSRSGCPPGGGTGATEGRCPVCLPGPPPQAPPPEPGPNPAGAVPVICQLWTELTGAIERMRRS